MRDDMEEGSFVSLRMTEKNSSRSTLNSKHEIASSVCLLAMTEGCYFNNFFDFRKGRANLSSPRNPAVFQAMIRGNSIRRRSGLMLTVPAKR